MDTKGPTPTPRIGITPRSRRHRRQTPPPPPPRITQKETLEATVSEDFTSGINKVTESKLQSFTSRVVSDSPYWRSSREKNLPRERQFIAREATEIELSTGESGNESSSGASFVSEKSPASPQQYSNNSRIHFHGMVAPELSTNLAHSSIKRKLSYTASDQDITSISKRTRQGARKNVLNLCSLPSTPALQADAADAPHNQPPSQLSLYQTLHRVTCDDYARTYEDYPKATGSHLLGENQVFGLKEYVERFPQLGFVVYKNYSCSPNCQGSKKSTGARDTRLLTSPLPTSENIAIVSPALRRTIESIATCHSDSEYDWHLKDYLVSTRPYPFLFHHFTELGTFREGSEISGQMDALLSYVLDSEPLLKEAHDYFAKGLVSRKTLPFLFCPNNLLITESPQRVLTVADWPENTELACWNFTPDGSGVSRRNESIKMPMCPNEAIPISSLTTYPLIFAPEKAISNILRRAKSLWALMKSPKLIEYAGLDFHSERVHCDTRFMVDYKTYKKLHPQAKVFRPEWEGVFQRRDFDKRPLTVRQHENMDDETLMLLPANVDGFDLNEKKWFNLWVDNVKEVKWNEQAFQQLVLHPPTKKMIKALIEIRAAPGGIENIMKRQDIISGKGQGLIMLLHGGPGTGKTLTAESVAEIAKMPLYRVSCGEMGANAEAVERYLNNVLYLGKAWNCIVLLDEADVFLEKRSLSDLDRNSLVSVFLRILDYYDGILILTTNRVGTFDEAFRSRIHISLHYKNLSPSYRGRIWNNLLSMLRDDGENADFDELAEHLPELEEEDMNGREIRNSLSTARQLALHQKEKLGWKHLELAIQTTSNFNRYLKDVHGGDAEDQARENFER